MQGSDKLSTSIRYTVRGSSGKSSLQIEDLCSADAGTYRCVAVNQIGRSACTFDLVCAGKTTSAQNLRIVNWLNLPVRAFARLNEYKLIRLNYRHYTPVAVRLNKC